jgi:hypothetical protein
VSGPLRVALAGNPNVGKTSLFNELTGSRHKVGNYAGVTVETREGAVASRWQATRPLTVVDLPGTYSLTPVSEDEAVAFRCLNGEVGAAPDLVVLVVDAANLARNLYLAMQLCELGRPLVLALNMMDVAAEAGVPVDAAALGGRWGCRWWRRWRARARAWRRWWRRSVASDMPRGTWPKCKVVCWARRCRRRWRGWDRRGRAGWWRRRRARRWG